MDTISFLTFFGEGLFGKAFLLIQNRNTLFKRREDFGRLFKTYKNPSCI